MADPGARRFIRPAPLSVTLAFDSPPEDGAAIAELYATLAESLAAAFSRASAYAGDDYDGLTDHLLGAVYRAAVAVPMTDTADVSSLGCYLHVVAAFASALAHDRITELVPDRPAIGIVAGDLSGIQEFIHSAPSKGAARSLRARSFYLQVLSLVAARFIARSCGLPGPALINLAGGNFWWLFPHHNSHA